MDDNGTPDLPSQGQVLPPAEDSVKLEQTSNSANGSTSSDKKIPDGPISSAESSKVTSATPESMDVNKSSEKKSVSGDDLYRRSSQYQTWSFSHTNLHQMKQNANGKGRKAALKLFEDSRQSLERDKPEIFAAHGDQLTAQILELVTFEEEQKYLHFFGQQIVQICSHFNMPTQVKATAIAFFRRFYLVNSVMEFRPRNILYTTVFLAAKSENYFISIDSFCSRIPKTKPEDILSLEFILLSSLKFTLLVHHPFRPLYGFFLDFQSILLHSSPVMYDVNVDTIGKLYDTAKKWLNDHALLSDVSFLYTPPQIALSALYDCDKRITDRYMRLKFLGENFDPHSSSEPGDKEKRTHFEMILRTVKMCIRDAKKETETSREESTKIDEKCFFALNPSKLMKRRIKSLQEEGT